MAIADGQSITIAGVASTLNRVLTDGPKSVYQKNDENLTETFSHEKSKDRIRSLMKCAQRIVAADVLTAENKFQTASISIIIDRPLVGFTATQIKDLWTGFTAQLSASSNLLIDKVYGQET